MKNILSIIFLLVCIAAAVLDAQVPRKIAFQGALTDGDGRLLPNNQYEVVFRLYTQAEGGNSIWTSPTERVTLINGLFNVILGANQQDTAFANVNLARPLWLGVSVSGAEMPTRFEITAAMYAVTAQVAERARKSDDGVPVGTIVAYYGEIATTSSVMIPEGWMLCNGQQIPQGEQYTAIRTLAEVAGHPNTLPDLRGMFLRGANLNRTGDFADPDANARTGTGQKIGSVQRDIFQRHKHVSQTQVSANSRGSAIFGHVNYSPAVSIGQGVNDAMLPFLPKTSDPVESENNSSTSIVGSETRPKNVYVNYIIKVK